MCNGTVLWCSTLQIGGCRFISICVLLLLDGCRNLINWSSIAIFLHICSTFVCVFCVVDKITKVAAVWRQKQTWFWGIYSEHRVKDTFSTKITTTSFSVPHLNEPPTCALCHLRWCTCFLLLKPTRWKKRTLKPLQNPACFTHSWYSVDIFIHHLSLPTQHRNLIV